LEEAITLLKHVVETRWDARFSQVEQVALMDLQRAQSMMRAKGFAFHAKQGQALIDKRLVAYELGVDIRVVVGWDSDLLDVELHCVEPNGETCYSLHNHTRIGGLMSRNFTGGYGPEEYMIRNAAPGEYIFKVKLFSPVLHTSLGVVTVSAKIYTNYARSHLNSTSPLHEQLQNKESEAIAVVQLTRPKECAEICRVFVPR